MRPIYIKMSAFGPYAGCTEIDMNKLGEQGLYLITGDTGAGKTTIFDAICYALFGEPSGQNREVSMFRSKYAAPETETVVELEFIHKGKEYSIKRNPEYMRPSKKGEGFTKQTAEAELHFPDGHVVTKIKDVNSEIEELLGINRKQFSQIAMLAQGDFLKLLLADTNERKGIFRELFNTNYYQTLQIRLEEKRKEINAQALDVKKSIKQYIDGIQVDKDDVLSIEVEKAKNDEMTVECVIELLDKLLEKDKEQKEKLDEAIEKINGELEKVNAGIGAAIALEKERKEVEELKKEQEKMKPLYSKYKADMENAEEQLKAKPGLIEEAHKIENELKSYDSVDRLVKEISEKDKLIIENNKILAKYENEIEKCKDELVKLQEEFSLIKDSGTALEKLKNEKEKTENKLNSAGDYLNAVKEYNKKIEELRRAQEKYQEDDAVFNKLNKQYELMEQSFRDGQAGILAEKLVEGEPCPVCGSTSHPAKAHLTEDIPSEKEIEEAKKKAQSARDKRDKSSEYAGSLRGALGSVEESLKNKAKELLGTDDINKSINMAEELKEKAAEELKVLKENIKKEEFNINRKKELEDKIPSDGEKISQIDSDIQKIKTSITEFNTEKKERSDLLGSLKKELKYDNRRAAEAAVRDLQAKADKLQGDFDKAKERFVAHEKKTEEIATRISTLQRNISDSDAPDLEEETKKQESLKEEQRLCNENKGDVDTKLRNNRYIRDNIMLSAENIAKIEKKHEWVKTLADTANGKLSGKDKIELETYIQTTYFDRIINRANQRLLTMSGGQYELIRLKEALNAKSKSGLELGVMDHYNGSQRSVKTLSGGESFIASLSLALGLSDEVQASAGGITVETMFVDEGFGSLDSESLDMAYKALTGLTEGNKLVGIISHVAELKDKIDKQVVVTKAKSGGSKVEIII